MKGYVFKLAACAAALAVSSTAAAQGARTGTISESLMSSAYVGGTVGRSDYDVSCIGPFACDREATGFKLFTGTRFNNVLGAELSYLHLGDVELGGGEDSRAHGINASLIAGVPLTQSISVNGKLGTTYGWTRIGGPGATGGGKRDDFGLSYGAGLNFNITRQVDVRVDWDRHRFEFTRGNEDVDLLSVGLQYRFQ